jgi:hypothetical protein
MEKELTCPFAGRVMGAVDYNNYDFFFVFLYFSIRQFFSFFQLFSAFT